jgi:hypothetical protein
MSLLVAAPPFLYIQASTQDANKESHRRNQPQVHTQRDTYNKSSRQAGFMVAHVKLCPHCCNKITLIGLNKNMLVGRSSSQGRRGGGWQRQAGQLLGCTSALVGMEGAEGRGGIPNLLGLRIERLSPALLLRYYSAPIGRACLIELPPWAYTCCLQVQEHNIGGRQGPMLAG